MSKETRESLHLSFPEIEEFEEGEEPDELTQPPIGWSPSADEIETEEEVETETESETEPEMSRGLLDRDRVLSPPLFPVRKSTSRLFVGDVLEMLILQPILTDTSFIWDQIEVRPSTKERGYGLFATTDLPPYTLLPYFGVKIYDQALTDRVTDKQAEYMFGDNPVIDGSPHLYPVTHYYKGQPINIGCRGLSVASYANEPNSEDLNALLMTSEEFTYPLNIPALITFQEIKRNEEIFVCYNRESEYKSSCPAQLQVPAKLTELLESESEHIKEWNQQYAKEYYNYPELVEYVVSAFT